MDKNRAFKIILDLMNKSVENGATEEEAASSMKKATELMVKHNIDIASMDKNRDKKSGNIEEVKFKTMYKERDWELFLGKACGEVFDCKMLLTNHWNTTSNFNHKEIHCINFIGHKSDLVMVGYFFKYLRNYAIHQACFYSKRKKEQNAFCSAFRLTVEKRLIELYKRIEEALDSSTMALVVKKKDAVNKFFKDKYPNIEYTNVKQSMGGSLSARTAGSKSGKAVPLGRPVTGGNGTTRAAIS